MAISLSVIICVLVFNILVAIVYFSKSKIKSAENKLYVKLLVASNIGLVTELLCFLFIYLKDQSLVYSFINELVNKSFIIYLLAWEFLFTQYIFFISFEDRAFFKKKIAPKKKSISLIISLLFALISFIVLIIPIYYNFGNYTYSYGPATNVPLFIGGICILIDIFSVLSNIKHVNTKKYFPLFILLILMIFVFVMRQINPGITIINSVFSFVTIIMYFTIENPDLKIINELYRNKELVEQTYEDKSNFLFEMTQEVRNPLFNVINVCDSLKNEDDINKIHEGLKLINNNIRQLDFTVNDILNVSSLDIQKLKRVSNRYNLQNLFNEIVSKVKTLIPDNIEFRSEIINTVTYLYGDSLKLKQVVLSIIMNSIKKTESGFIEFKINTIEKYDVCRLIIVIQDSGQGMSIDSINEILSSTGSLNQEDIKNMEKLEMDIELCQKVIKLLGGHLMIKSNPGKGSETILTVDQRIYKPIDNESILDKYENYISSSKKVLVVSQDKSLIETLKKKFNKENISCSFMLYGQDAIDKIKRGKKYDYIILEDEMRGMNGYTILKNLKEIDKFNIPIIILLDKNKENIKQNYLKDGFSDIILVSNLSDEIDRIVSSY